MSFLFCMVAIEITKKFVNDTKVFCLFQKPFKQQTKQQLLERDKTKKKNNKERKDKKKYFLFLYPNIKFHRWVEKKLYIYIHNFECV